MAKTGVLDSMILLCIVNPECYLIEGNPNGAMIIYIENLIFLSKVSNKDDEMLNQVI